MTKREKWLTAVGVVAAIVCTVYTIGNVKEFVSFAKNHNTAMEEKSNKSTPMYLYTERELNKLYAYIEQQYGESKEDIHEMVSFDIHLDVTVIPPTDEQPYYKLVTTGAGAFKMNVPDKYKPYKLERAEYVIFLPKDWDIKSTKEEDYWPIRMLKNVARLPIATDSWLTYGHTVQMTEDASPVAGNTGFNSCVLIGSFGKNNQEVEPVKLGLFGKTINFYQIYPLYNEEMEFLFEHSLSELSERISDEDMDPIVNIHRKNFCE